MIRKSLQCPRNRYREATRIFLPAGRYGTTMKISCGRLETKSYPYARRKLLGELSPTDRRRISQIDNICSCVRRDVFEKYEFNDLPYAEDLDLGLRLLESGYKIGFLSSVGVIHSHIREAAYYFKRSYMDRKVLIQLLDMAPANWSARGINSFPEMLGYIHSTYRKLSAAFNRLNLVKLPGKGENVPLMAMLQDTLSSHSAGDGCAGEQSLEKVSRTLRRLTGFATAGSW